MSNKPERLFGSRNEEEEELKSLDESDAEDSNIFDNIRNKKAYCKDNPSAEKCQKEDRPSKKNWKKAQYG